MVTLLGVPYAEYIGGGIILAVIIFFIWVLLKSKGGRLAEEQEEERETQQLISYEEGAEGAEKRERKDCTEMEGIIEEIFKTLKSGKMGEVADKMLYQKATIKLMIGRLRKEEMNDERAMDTFRQLHVALNELISELQGSNNNYINKLIQKLMYYQKDYYKNLVKEITENRNKRAVLSKLSAQVIDQEKGRGQLQAA